VALDPEPGLRIPNMLDAALDGTFRAIYIQGEDILQSDPDTHHVAAGLAAMDCVIVHDLFLNETANYAHVFLPGIDLPRKERHLHQRRTPHPAGAQGDGTGERI
jgi:formate dehydrogenase major subunit